MTRTYLQRAALACAAALAFGALVQSAAAQSNSPAMKAVRNHCSSDFVKHCARVRPGGREALACLEQQIEKLSQPCQDALFAIMPPPTQVTNEPGPAGQQDASTPPPAAAQKDAADASAQQQQQQDTAAPARAAAQPPATAARASAAPPRRARAAAEPARLPHPSAAEQRALRKYCRKDYFANCRGIPPGSPDTLACLQGNLAHLSRGCRRVVSAIAPQRPSPIVSAPPPRAVQERRAARDAVAEPPPPAREADALPPGRDDGAAQPAAADDAGTTERADAANQTTQDDDAAPPARADYAPPAHRDEAPTAHAERTPARAEPVPAPAPVETTALRAYCRRDFAALCPSLRPGSSAAISCLKRRAHVLTPRCRRAVRETMSAPQGGPRASVAPARERAASRPPRHRRSALPPPSAAELARACRSDLYRHCRRVRPGGGREFSCLVTHQRALSFHCRTALRRSLR